jgi:hypothetical protein
MLIAQEAEARDPAESNVSPHEIDFLETLVGPGSPERRTQPSAPAMPLPPEGPKK